MQPTRIKLVVAGDSPALNASLLSHYNKQASMPDYQSVLFGNVTVSLTIKSTPIHLELCDTSGQEPYDKIQPLSIATADVVIIVFDSNDFTQFQDPTHKWFQKVRKAAPKALIEMVGSSPSKHVKNNNRSRFLSKKEITLRMANLKCCYSQFQVQDRSSKTFLFEQIIDRYLQSKSKRLCGKTPGCFSGHSGEDCQLI